MLDVLNENYNILDKDTSRSDFVKDYLNRTLTMFTYKDLPESIPEVDLELILQTHGYGLITEHHNELVALWGSFASPCNVYYRETEIIVNNPWAGINRKYTIEKDKDGVLIKNDPLQRGLLPIFNRYGTLMTEAQITYWRALINFRAMFVFTGDEDADQQTAKLFMDKIEKGESGTIVTGGFENNIQAQPLLAQTSNYITQAIEAQQYVLGMLYQQIGLQSTFNMKRERQTANETNLDTDPLRPLIDAMLEERQKALDKINKKYGTNISVEFNGVWSKYNGDNSTESDCIVVSGDNNGDCNINESSEINDNQETENEIQTEDSNNEEPEEATDNDIKINITIEEDTADDDR